MSNLSIFGKINLSLGVALFLVGCYLLVEETKNNNFIFPNSLSIVYLGLGISIMLSSFLYINKSK